MSLTRWLRNLRSILAPGHAERKRWRQSIRTATHRPYLEALEDRCLLSFTLPAANYDVGANPQAVVAADFNNDAVLDLAAVNYNNSTVSVLLGNAGGTFQPALTFRTGPDPLAPSYSRSLAVGDFDGDGNLDLATANGADVSVLLGNGQGAFGAPTSIDIGSSPTSVAVGDFNADGNLDLGVASNVYYPGTPGYWGYYGYYEGTPGYNVGRANVLLGNGAGEFATPSTTVIGGGYPASAAVADLNGDGHQDFATATFDAGTVSVLLGSGTGALGAPTDFGIGNNPVSVAAGDMNGDGKLDLVTANRYHHNVSVLLGDGLGAFEAAQNYATNIGPGSVVLPDFNNDGHLDIATANYDSADSTVLLGRGDGTYLPPQNFATGAGAVSVAAGDFNDDGWVDAVTANNASGYTVSVLINDQVWPPVTPTLTINDVTVTEGNTGSMSATFTLSLSPAYGQPVTVHYVTANGTATAGSDYTAASGDMIFAAGQTSTTVTIAVLGDRLGELNESFVVNLSTADAFIGDGQGVGTILDDEPRISIDDVEVTEGNTGSGNATFTLTLSAAYDQPVTVHFATANGSAAAGSDYTAGAGNLTIAAGQTTKTFTVAVFGDRLPEPTESFVVNLSAATNGRIVDSQGIGTILDNEPRIAIGNVSKKEGAKGQTTLFTFTVTLSAAYDQAVTMSYQTVNGTAKANDKDYIAKTGTLTFAPGETTKTITIEVKGDSKWEPNEIFYLDLSGNSGNSLFTKIRGVGTIQNDD